VLDALILNGWLALAARAEAFSLHRGDKASAGVVGKGGGEAGATQRPRFCQSPRSMYQVPFPIADT
jgi:hypothetical protein